MLDENSRWTQGRQGKRQLATSGDHSLNGNGVGGRSQITNCTWRMNRGKVLNQNKLSFVPRFLAMKRKTMTGHWPGVLLGQSFFFFCLRERHVCSGIFCNDNENLSIQFMVPFSPQPRWPAHSTCAEGKGRTQHNTEIGVNAKGSWLTYERMARHSDQPGLPLCRLPVSGLR